MPIAIRKGCRFANLLAVFCIAVFLCAAPGAAAEPQTASATAVKKKVALAQFDVLNTIHVNDISNIYDGLPQALADRLEAGGGFLPVYTGRQVPAESGAAQREAIMRIAEETGAQFLVYGMVVNAGIKQEKGYLGTPIGGYKRRHIEIEFAVHDGFSGTRLLLRRLDDQVQGDVMVGNDKPFGSSIFLETQLGQALSRLIDLAVADIRATLGEVPFSARIVRVEGDKVVLDAGSDSLLKPGDKLVAYARDAITVDGTKGAALGFAERAADTVTLTQVQPQFAVGELTQDAAKNGIEAGNFARIDQNEVRALLAKQIAAQQKARAEQEALAEAERIKAEQAAQAEAVRIKAEQEAKAEAARLKAEKAAAARAKAQAAAEAKAARLKAQREARAARIKAAQEARARELTRQKARAAAEAKAAKLKAQQEAKAEAACIEVEKKLRAEMETMCASVPPAAASGVAQTRTGAEVAAEANAASAPVAPASAPEPASAPAPAPAKVKQGVPLKLKQISP